MAPPRPKGGSTARALLLSDLLTPLGKCRLDLDTISFRDELQTKLGPNSAINFGFELAHWAASLSIVCTDDFTAGVLWLVLVICIGSSSLRLYLSFGVALLFAFVD